MMIKKYHFFITLFFMITLMSCAQERTKLPKSYVAYNTSETLQIDGNADENSWKQAQWTDLFIDIEGVKKPKYNTKIKMLWDDEYYYVLAKLEEPHIWGDITEHDAIIFHNNDFEIFINPEGGSHNYYEIEINALNTVWDLFLSKPYREDGHPVLNNWEATGLKSAIQIDGTLNDSTDTDKEWTLEIAIPWKAFRTSYFQDNVPKDKFWRVNFSRVNWDHQITNGKYERKKDAQGELLHEYNWVWSPQDVINMHEPEKWGYVYFSSKQAGQQDTFNIPDDEIVKLKLFEIYRSQKEYFSKNKNWSTSLDEIGFTEIKVNDKIIKPILENHSLGYNVIVKSPYTGKPNYYTRRR